MMDDSQEVAPRDWPEGPPRDDSWRQRPLLLALLGLATGLVSHWVILAGSRHGYPWEWNLPATTLAVLTAITVSAALIGFTVERRRWPAAVAFSVAAGLVAAGLVYWNGPSGSWGAGEGWRTLSLFLSVAIAAPLFQAAQGEGRPRFPYRSVHDHAWINVVLWCAAWAFVGLTFAMLFLLAALFKLVKIGFLYDLMTSAWFWRALTGLSFGAALGLLREHDGVVRLLQRVVTMVLAVLAPVLAAGLIFFLISLPVTGLDSLWEAGSATAILLACVIGALILANAVIGDGPEDERRFPALRYGAMGLAGAMLPLGIIATVAIGLRVGQYGYTPERLWAMVFVGIACAYGAAYLISLILGRMEWAAKVRPANLMLAFGLCGLTLLLATPLLGFNAISARDQVARLESGKVAPDKFDWRALAFDFGTPGRDALKRLQASANPLVRARAIEVAKANSKWDVGSVDAADMKAKRRAELDANLRVLPAGTTVPPELRDLLANNASCSGTRKCTLWLNGTEAVQIPEDCFDARFAGDKPAPWNCYAPRFAVVDGKWTSSDRRSPIQLDRNQRAALQADYAAGKIEVRKVERRQAFVGGVPVGEAFE